MANDRLPNGRKLMTVDKIKSPMKSSLVSGPFGSNIGKRFFVDSGVPVIRGNNLTLGASGGRFIDEDYVFITEEKANELQHSSAEQNDLIFTARGTIGQVGLIPPSAKYKRYILSANQLRLRCDTAIAFPLYVYYWFSSPQMVNVMASHNLGTALPNMNLGALRSLPILLPPLSEQHAIAHILGTLDDKIELNRQMNQTLEAMAQALFKSWFIDFEPFRNQGIQDSSLGPIPRGWRVGTIGSEVSVVGGSTPSTKESCYWNGGTYHWATPKDLSELENIILLNTERKITEDGLATISSGLLPSGTVLLSSRAPIGYLAVSLIPVAINQGFIAMIVVNQRNGTLFEPNTLV